MFPIIVLQDDFKKAASISHHNPINYHPSFTGKEMVFNLCMYYVCMRVYEWVRLQGKGQEQGARE